VSFRLPHEAALTPDEQRPAITYPLDSDLWVTGAPGTGKTTVAIHRAQRLRSGQHERPPVLLLMIHGKAQRLMLQRTLNDCGLEEAVLPWGSWIVKRYAAITRRRIPEVSPERPDWSAGAPTLIEHFEKRGAEIDHLILDDAHAIPPAALAILRSAARYVTALSNPHANDVDVGAALGITTVHPLTHHHRLSREIAAVTDLFSRHGATTANAPKRSGPRPEMLEVESASQAFDHVTAYAVAHPEARIGVIVPDGRWHQTIQRVSTARSRGTVEILRDSNRTFTFERAGVSVVTYEAALGAEFDAVFLPLLHTDAVTPDERTRQALYLACSRARESLFILHPPISGAWAVQQLVQHDALLDWFTLRNDPADAA
jgi:superfamily I DNA/RNA helicase